MKTSLIQSMFSMWAGLHPPRILKLMSCCFVGVILSGCGSRPVPDFSPAPEKPAGSRKDQIQRGDTLRIQFTAPGYTGQPARVKVDDEGFVELPLLGKRLAAGSRPHAFANQLSQEYSLIRRIKVEVSIISVAPSKDQILRGDTLKLQFIMSGDTVQPIQVKVDNEGFVQLMLLGKRLAAGLVSTELSNQLSHDYSVIQKKVVKVEVSIMYTPPLHGSP